MTTLNPLLETDKIECIHKGKVIFQSSTKDLMCVQDSSGTDAGVINLQDLANAVIIGCANNIAGIPNPCTKLVSIPNSITSSLLEIDNQKIVLAQTISQVITDKGSPLILQGEPKAKDILELDEDITENAQNTQSNNIKSISEPSGDSSADLNESNAKSNNESSSKSSKNSNKDSQAQKEQMVLEVVRKWKTLQENMADIRSENVQAENAKVQNARILGVKMIKKLHKILLALSFAGCYICVAFDLREVYNQKDYARCEDDEKFWEICGNIIRQKGL